jgi:hypothetical protein
VVAVALVALVLVGWVTDVAVNSATRHNVQQRVAQAISNGMQEAFLVTPLTRTGTGPGSYYLPDIFRNNTMSMCVAQAAWDAALQELDQDQSAPLVGLGLPTIWPAGAADQVNVVVSVRYAGWLGREGSDTLGVTVTLPHYARWHKAAGFPGPVECSGP